MDTLSNQNFIMPAQVRGDRQLFAAVAAAASGTSTTHSAPIADNLYHRASDAVESHQHHDGYDDGLVHCHGWAVSDR
jgi:hypothetical protein